MKKPVTEKKFTVLLSRPCDQYTRITITARNTREAGRLAVEEAEQYSQDWSSADDDEPGEPKVMKWRRQNEDARHHPKRRRPVPGMERLPRPRRS